MSSCRFLLCVWGLLILFAQEGDSTTLSLNGSWDFAVDSSATFGITDVVSRASWRTAQVPLSWQAQFSDLRDYQGVAWYRKTFRLWALNGSETAFISFGAVDYLSTVYVNGVKVGTHEGGYTPFLFDIRKAVRPGENEVIVRVIDPSREGNGTEGLNYRHIPHGKQSWYVQTSGLWQGVDIVIKPKRSIGRLQITPEIDGALTSEIWLRGAEDIKSWTDLRLEVFDPHGSSVLVVRKTLPAQETHLVIRERIKNPELWSFDAPSLYRAVASLGKTDTVAESFGFRSIQAKNKRLLLNGNPFYLIGALDQDFYPQSVYSTPSEEYLRDEMLKAKKIGLNTLRCHIKIPDPRYLKVADEVGLLIWQEIPNWDVFTPEAGQRAMATLAGMLERDWNHPSLVIVSLINESWGLDLQKPGQRQWLKSAFNEAKRMASGRLVVDNSACWGNFHVKTDINDYHTYWSIPEHKDRFDRTVDDFASRPDWLFSEFGDAEQTKEEPLVLSEFGNWGLPKLPDPPPWWVARKFGDAHVVLPQDYEVRFQQYRYGETFRNYELLAEASQRSQFAALKYQIEQLRVTSGIEGYVITEFTDINWESNGLLDMWRNVKVYGDDLANIQQQDVVVPRPERYNYWSGDTVQVRVWSSHYSGLEIRDPVLSWTCSMGEHGSANLTEIPKGVPLELTTLQVPTRPVQAPQRLRVEVSLTARDDPRLLARNYCDVFVYPRPGKSATVPAEFYDPKSKLGSCGKFLMGTLPKGGSKSAMVNLIVTNVIDSSVVRGLDEGAAVLCLADSSTTLPTGFPFRFVRRESEWYDGNWATSLNWVRSEKAPLREISFGNTLGFEASSVSPTLVIDGIAPDDFSDVLAGMFVGWIHLNSGYVVQMRRGLGTLLLCTLPLAENVGRDPYASALFGNLLGYLAGNECRPALRWADR